MDVKNTAQESFQILGMIAFIFSVFKFKSKSNWQQNPVNPPGTVCTEGTTGLWRPWASSLGSSWREPHHGCSCLQLCCHTRCACLAMCSMGWTPHDVAGAQSWLITRTLPYPLDSCLDQATNSSLPSSLHLMCCNRTLISEVHTLVTLAFGDQSPLVAPWWIKDNFI